MEAWRAERALNFGGPVEFLAKSVPRDGGRPGLTPKITDAGAHNRTLERRWESWRSPVSGSGAANMSHYEHVTCFGRQCQISMRGASRRRSRPLHRFSGGLEWVSLRPRRKAPCRRPRAVTAPGYGRRRPALGPSVIALTISCVQPPRLAPPPSASRPAPVSKCSPRASGK
jgi:hypothetical protein